MIIFDTNLVSELLKDGCNPQVRHWSKSVPSTDMFTTSINLAGLRLGAAYLPEGKRKSALQRDIEIYIRIAFANRVIPFDDDSSRIFAATLEAMKLRGKAISFADGQIAAMALQHSCAVATRDVQPFRDAGIEVINPWEDQK